MAGTLHCSVLSPDGSIFEGEIAFIEAHALDGRLGILPGHAPLITALGDGPLRIRLEGQDDRKWQVSGGFLEVLDNHVSVLAEGLEQV
ncbi:MAG: ATP synthase F1 subunit epsilon [Planctomycetota bacterium]|jgi:F-type H+-transporting ATPase subunit epsilon